MLFQLCVKILNLLIENTPDVAEDTSDVVDPLYKALDIILPVALGVILLSGTLYAVAIGVQYSRAEDSSARAGAKKKLINAIVGFGIVLTLISVLYAIRGPIVNLINNK